MGDKDPAKERLYSALTKVVGNTIARLTAAAGGKEMPARVEGSAPPGLPIHPRRAPRVLIIPKNGEYFSYSEKLLAKRFGIKIGDEE